MWDNWDRTASDEWAFKSLSYFSGERRKWSGLSAVIVIMALNISIIDPLRTITGAAKEGLEMC